MADMNDSVNLFDLETQQCPYDAYRTLRNDAPVYQCPHTGMYIVTRFDEDGAGSNSDPWRMAERSIEE